MNQPGITSPIIGPRTMEQFEDNLKAMEVMVSDEDRERLDEVAKPFAPAANYYEVDFGPHLYRI